MFALAHSLERSVEALLILAVEVYMSMSRLRPLHEIVLERKGFHDRVAVLGRGNGDLGAIIFDCQNESACQHEHGNERNNDDLLHGNLLLELEGSIIALE